MKLDLWNDCEDVCHAIKHIEDITTSPVALIYQEDL